MNPNLRKTLMAGAIAALITSPAWASEDAAKRQAETPQAETGEYQRGPGATPPMGEGRGVGPGATPPMGEGRGVGPGAIPPMGEGRGVGPGGTPPMGAGPGDAITDNPLYGRTPDELRDFDVVDAEGEKIGKIKAVVLGPERDDARAVIGVGGFLGLGDREVIVSLDELELIDDKLRVVATQEELEAREYVPELYVELEPDKPISEFSALEPLPNESEPGAADADDTGAGSGMSEEPREQQ